MAQNIMQQRQDELIEQQIARWQSKTDEAGWTNLTRGNCRITVPPDGPTAEVPAHLFAPGCTTEHPTVTAAKRAARSRLHRGF